MKIACIIPARLASQRFPKKMLSILGSQPLLKWVWDAANRCSFDDIAFAIDAKETADLIASFGGNFFFTSPHCLSGTDRLIELQRRQLITADIWVNWQGDEPFIRREMVDDLLQTVDEKEFDVWSLKKKVTDEKELHSPDVVKVVANKEGRALYFSRSPIPYVRQHREGDSPWFKHIGMYAFTDSALRRLAPLSSSPLEEVEQLEQLRFLEHGLCIQLHSTLYDTLAIDHPEDLIRASEWILNTSSF